MAAFAVNERRVAPQSGSTSRRESRASVADDRSLHTPSLPCRRRKTRSAASVFASQRDVFGAARPLATVEYAGFRQTLATRSARTLRELSGEPRFLATPNADRAGASTAIDRDPHHPAVLDGVALASVADSPVRVAEAAYLLLERR